MEITTEMIKELRAATNANPASGAIQRRALGLWAGGQGPGTTNSLNSSLPPFAAIGASAGGFR